MEELLDIYSKDGKKLGMKTREECHQKNPGFYHKPVWIWIYNSQGELLVQKRASCKKNMPNLWDMPVGGHVDAGETSIQGAIRETSEEIGIKVNENDFEFIGEYIQEDCWEIGQIYFLKLDKKIEEFKLQVEEVSKVKWLNFEEFKELLNSDEFVPYDKEYKDMIIEKIKDVSKISESWK